QFKVDELDVRVLADADSLARAVAELARAHLASVLARRGSAAVILATGNSQIRFLDTLVQLGGVDWSRVTAFHMDEYLGLPGDHPASFRRYMRERIASRLNLRAFHYIEGDALQPIDECERYARLLEAQPIDLCCLGIGENGHLAFNDPPVADFADKRLVKIVQLDLACRQQQVGEGHFPSVDAVPAYAITLTIPALCRAERILCVAPEKRKARAVRDALRGPVSPACPASILRRQPHATLFLDGDSTSLL
ncbi:MAG TPA: glucosamine-6-phosphate deaminase, partial [Methylomirabilota bacterium]|nr:glucosamine-6-phosphate deaminase [Methylomirabilota bacterium]